MLLRSTLLGALAGMFLAVGAHATTLTLDDLVNGGQSFQSDNGVLTFDNFQVTGSKRLSTDLTQYTVTSTQDGFVLTSNEFDAQSGGVRKLDLTYTVTGTSPIVQVGLQMDATRTTGRAKVEKDIDEPGNDTDNSTFLATILTATQSVLSDSDQLETGASSLDVSTHVRIKKVSSIASITDSYQIVPEPGTLLLLGAGLAGLGWIGRRRSY